MKCRRVRHHFSLLRDGALTTEDKIRVDHHLQSCRDCVGEWLLYEQSLQLLQGEPKVKAPADTWSRFYQSLEAAKPALEKEERQEEELVPLSIFSAAAVSFALVMLVVTLVVDRADLQTMAAQDLLTKNNDVEELSLI